MAAKQVTCNTGVEVVFRQTVLARFQFEMIRFHDQVQVSGLFADRTIALLRSNPAWNLNNKLHTATMAATWNLIKLFMSVQLDSPQFPQAAPHEPGIRRSITLSFVQKSGNILTDGGQSPSFQCPAQL